VFDFSNFLKAGGLSEKISSLSLFKLSFTQQKFDVDIDLRNSYCPIVQSFRIKRDRFAMEIFSPYHFKTSKRTVPGTVRFENGFYAYAAIRSPKPKANYDGVLLIDSGCFILFS
jgi:hypothetical protein